jgi:hypothetical protein
MRFWRSLGLLALALGILALPAHAADSKQQEPAKPPPVVLTPEAAKPAAPAVAAPAGKPAKPSTATTAHSSTPERRAWMVGFDYGLGSGSFNGTGLAAFSGLGPEGFSASTREWGKVVQFRFGYALRPSAAVTFSRTNWSKTLNGDDWKIGLSAMNYTWYPEGGQFYVRGGFGVGDASDKDIIDQSTGQHILHIDDGFGMVGAVGYEWTVYKRMSLAPQAEAAYISLDEKVFADMFNFTVAVNWWF